MGFATTLVPVLLVLGFLWLIFYLFTNGAEQRALNQRERLELNRLRELVDDLKDTAWDHRELDSPLSTIVIDKIREHERRSRELGP
ncbi:MAG TPA: hypothetical protein VLA97_14380 [Nocardioidaceae bacterium]|jgi:hypothetical protein|nr:hypothetical protein [Nocardioidaceae bacterium]